MPKYRFVVDSNSIKSNIKYYKTVLNTTAEHFNISETVTE